MSLADALVAVRDEFGDGSAFLLGDNEARVPVETISTGAITLDVALGGGVPRGRIVEIFGPESSGKTTLVLHILASAQSRGLGVAFIDAEHALDPVYAEAIGANPAEFLLSQPDYGEQALSIVDRLIGQVGVIAVDSVAALTPRAELDGEMGQANIGLQARMMSQAMRKLVARAHTENTLVLFTNQIREKVGVFWGSPETQPGGRALKFYASQRLDIRRISKDETGQRVRVKIIKNKIAPPFKTAEFTIRYGSGIDHVGDVIDRGIEQGAIKKSGGWYIAEDGFKAHGYEALRAHVQEELCQSHA